MFLDKKEELLAKKAALAEQLLQEQEAFARMPETQYAYTMFAAKVAMQQQNFDQFIAGIDQQVDALQEKMSEAFQELKRYEILKDKKEQEAAQERARKDSIALDEMGANLHRRQQQEDSELHDE